MIRAFTLLKLGQLNSETTLQGQEACRVIKDNIHLANFYSAELALLIAQQEFVKAGEYTTAKQQFIEDTGFAQVIALFKGYGAIAYWRNGLLDEAETLALELLELELSDYNESRIRAFEVLYQLASERGNTEQAFTYYQAYHHADKAAIDSTQAKMLAYEQARHQLADKERQLETLAYVREVEMLENKVTRQSLREERYFMMLLVATIIVLVSFIAKGAINRNRFQAEDEQDSLTGMLTRRAFIDKLLECHDECRVAKNNLTLAVCDIDDFRHINQCYSYHTGDGVLFHIASQIDKQLTKPAFIGRTGGDEFMIVLPGQDCMQSCLLIGQLIKQINNIDVRALGINDKLTVSFGLADAQQCKYNLSILQASAERALATSKATGKNRYTISTVKPVSETAIAYT